MLTKVRSKVFIFLIIISALFLILSGCGSDSSKNTTSVLNSIEITPASIYTMVDETMELTAVGRDQNGEIMTINPSWSISGNVGSISPTEGSSTTFTAATLGEGSITATVGDISGSAEIIVAQQPAVLTELEISPSAASLYDGDTLDLTVTGYDQYDQVISCNPSWSISTELGTFNPESGTDTTFTANSTGTATITAADGTVSDSINIIINEAPELTYILISPDSPDPMVINEGETMSFTASGYDQNDNPYPISPTWNVTGNTGTVSPETGTSTTFTATNPGNGTLQASDGLVSASINVTVNQTTIYVPGDYITIQEAVDAAEDGMTIIVDEGTYNEALTISSKNITLKNTDPENPAAVANTIIDAGGSSSTNGSTIVISGASTDTVTIEGFTITGGIGSSTIGTTSQYGGGIHIHTVKTILRNNIITGNEAHDGGGAIYGYMCDMTLEGNTIENNSSYLAGGGINIGASSGYTLNVDMTDNIIRNNESEDRNAGGIYTWNVGGIWSGNIIDGNSAGTYAGAIHLNHSSPDIIDNSIINNTADSIAGISIDDNSFPTIQNNIISGNQSASINSRGGGLSIASEGLILSGNEISNNSAVIGAGVYASSVITLDNNNISNNSASSTGGGIYTTKDITLTNNTLDSNTALQGGGIALYADDKVLTAEGNEFTNNSEYAILLHSNASYEDNGGNTFSGNTPDDILQ